MTAITAEQQQTVTDAVARLAELNARVTELEQQRDGLKTFIRLTLGPGTHTAGDLRVSVVARKVFDPKLAVNVIPESLLPLVSVPRIDPDRARELLPEAVYSRCLKETAAQVRLT